MRPSWSYVSTSETFHFLYRQLIDDHGLDSVTALEILEAAFNATLDEAYDRQTRMKPSCA